MTKPYECVKRFLTLKSGPKRGETVFVGDHEDAERWKDVKKTSVDRKHPSQWHSRFPDGYIQFAHRIPFARSRRYFDLSKRAVCGVPVFIFRYTAELDIICRRLTAIKQLKEYTKDLRGPDLHAFAELVLYLVDPNHRGWANDEWARTQILRYLPALSLNQLENLVDENLVDAVRPSSSEPSVGWPRTKTG